MASVYDCAVDTDLLTGFRLAKVSLDRNELVVLPTDTVYGIGADAFDSAAVTALLAAKGRGRDPLSRTGRGASGGQRGPDGEDRSGAARIARACRSCRDLPRLRAGGRCDAPPALRDRGRGRRGTRQPVLLSVG